MSYVARLVKHESLMTRMAARNGADVDLALMTGALEPGDLHEGAFRCMGCHKVSDCEQRLDADTPGIPDYCRNADMIEELRTLLNVAD